MKQIANKEGILLETRYGYWGSTEYLVNNAYRLFTYEGYVYDYSKRSHGYVRSFINV